MRPSMLVMTGLLVLTFLSSGCSSTNTQSGASEANANANTSNSTLTYDPNLTYDLVIQNVDAYKGKRVRWFGQQSSFGPDSKPDPNTKSIRVMFGDMRFAMQGFHAFVVEFERKEQVPTLGAEGWITGIIVGTHTTSTIRSSPSGKESKTPTILPLLSNPEFERGAGNR
jgi:hypothetical protein